MNNFLLASLLVLTASLAGASEARADTCGSVSFTVTPAEGPPGTPIRIEGSGALPRSPWGIYWEFYNYGEFRSDGVQLVSGLAGADGRFAADTSVPMQIIHTSLFVSKQHLHLWGVDAQSTVIDYCFEEFSVTNYNPVEEDDTAVQVDDSPVQEDAYNGWDEAGIAHDAYSSRRTLPITGLTVFAPAAGLLLGGGALFIRRRRPRAG